MSSIIYAGATTECGVVSVRPCSTNALAGGADLTSGGGGGGNV